MKNWEPAESGCSALTIERTPSVCLKSFEKPLTPEEEVYYLNLLKNENNKEAKEVLVQRNMRLVAHISKKYNNSGEELDDLISIGTIGLIKAIDTFNVDKGIRLATYASKCIENEILMNIRSNKKNKMQVSLQDPIGVDKEGNAISLIDILGTDEDYVVDKVELKMKISKLYEKIEKVLTEREKEIIKLRYGLTPSGYKTQREIAQQLDISRSYVSRIEKKALKKLKRELNIDKNNINKKNKNDKDKTDKKEENATSEEGQDTTTSMEQHSEEESNSENPGIQGQENPTVGQETTHRTSPAQG